MKPRPLALLIVLTLFATVGITVQTPAQTKQSQSSHSTPLVLA
jgi:hypothetical protein